MAQFIEPTPDASVAASQTYFLTSRARWTHGIVVTMLLSSGFALLVTGVKLLLIVAWWFALPLLLPAILLIAIGGMQWYNLVWMRLIIGEALTLHACGYTLQTTWSDINHLGSRWGETCLVLDPPATIVGPLRWLPRLYQFDYVLFLSPWGQWWGTTRFAQDLHARIPHIITATHAPGSEPGH